MILFFCYLYYFFLIKEQHSQSIITNEGNIYLNKLYSEGNYRNINENYRNIDENKRNITENKGNIVDLNEKIVSILVSTKFEMLSDF